MDKKDLELQVAAVVAELFNEKEEAELRRKTEDELNKSAASILDLTSALEQKNVEVAEFESKISEKDSTIQQLTSELEAAKIEIADISVKLTESEKALDNMAKERAAEKRMIELEGAGVARSDRESQMAKVKEMSDEEFASYKDELVSIREAVTKELEEARIAQIAEADAKAEVEAAKKVAEEASKEVSEEEKPEEVASDNKEKEEDVVTPAYISPDHAAMASLNMEFAASKDVMAKYADLGKAMANRWKKNTKE